MLDKSRALNTLTTVMNHFGQIQLRAYHAHLCLLRRQGSVRLRLDSHLAASLHQLTETRTVPKPGALEDTN